MGFYRHMVRPRPVVPGGIRNLDFSCVSGPSPKEIPTPKGNCGYISLRFGNFHHHRLHYSHKDTVGELSSMEDSSFCPDPMLPHDVCPGLCHRKPVRDKYNIHGCGSSDRLDLHGLRANDHFLQRCDDEAGSWQPGFDSRAIDAG